MKARPRIVAAVAVLCVVTAPTAPALAAWDWSDVVKHYGDETAYGFVMIFTREVVISDAFTGTFFDHDYWYEDGETHLAFFGGTVAPGSYAGIAFNFSPG